MQAQAGKSAYLAGLGVVGALLSAPAQGAQVGLT